MLAKCLLAKCLLAKCLLAKCLLAKCLLAKCLSMKCCVSQMSFGLKFFEYKTSNPFVPHLAMTLRNCS